MRDSGLKEKDRIVTVLVIFIVLLAGVAASAGIFSGSGPGSFEIESVRGETVQIYGKGIYKHMSADVAPQGIAQDVVTLFIGIPLLLIVFWQTRKGSLRARFLLAGVLGYFLVTYLFYLVMGMYNALFLVYAALLGLSFHAFSLVMISLGSLDLQQLFTERTPHKAAGAFLMIDAVLIGALWLQIVVPPLLDGTIIPLQVEHYTTLIVQGLDLGLLLPLAFVAGWLFYRKKPFGYLLAPVYLGFLSLMMTALVAKIIGMGILGQNIIPVIFIIPAITLISVYLLVKTLKVIKP
ncbi:hypothetical protein [Rhodohalobacter mucosus]|uniref:Uncharacterized protein n=1 Tax=Rhodohalobacter mucosus TaxID=2079485 RepID=A0A316TR53_9BACT|nr:hypothetical protein [Rhodohalobacter mucosus]PWN06288.1 hypothetical protein DDZ15_10715 [Rhodohalobacter mucosus]